ncbi:hypothetical protein [Aquabacterium sp. CECT 9606]|uniref:hypothetical protein n=1 Tax=Aquabacterium sp. CECT 9606 TaxID=2845822 RepID=UPI001E51F1AB|nr:hypothetical protein [Aquabacterium sp. CECT 9606]
MRLLRFFIAPVVIAVLSACVNVPSDYKFDDKKVVGVVIGSITYESGLGLYRVLVTPENGDKTYFLQAGSGDWYPFVKNTDEDLQAKGDTFAVELPTGKYVIKSWQVRQGARTANSSMPIGIPFSVEAGKAIYLGSFNWSPDWENVSLRDKSNRDLPIIKKRFPFLERTPLALAITNGAKIDGLGGDYRYRYDIFIPVPVAPR